MKCKFRHIFEPITIRGMKVKNRVVMMPMGSNMAMPDGGMSDSHLNYYRLRAKGGTGLILVENVTVTYPEGSNGATQLRLDHDCYIPRFYELCEAVHAYGGCIGVQINHAGSCASSSRIGMQPVSASDIPCRAGGETPRALTKEEILAIVEDFAKAAKRAKMAGFDCVEIHAGHAYLLSQFLSPTMNDRTDEFGGTPENRARFTSLVLKAIRREVGEDYPVFMRVSGDELVPGGNDLEDCLEYLQYLVDDVDVLDVSAAIKSSPEHSSIDSGSRPDGWRAYMARAVKERYGKPVITMGNIREPQRAEALLANGDADFIGIGRGLIADPEWVNKTMRGEADSIRKCISCNIGCAAHRGALNRPIRCTVNPDLCGGEGHRKRRADRPCRVVVLGGGMAGLEAACTAAEVGCEVTLLERKPELGGLAREISLLPEKKRIADALRYQLHRADQLENLTILTGVHVTMEKIQACNPDLIVNATGSRPFVPPVEGRELVGKGDSVDTVLGLIEHREDRYAGDHTGKKVLVVGGGAVGMDIMEFFARRGAQVTVVEMLSDIGRDLEAISKKEFLNLMKKHQVEVLTKTRLQAIREGSFLLENEQGLFEKEFDYGFLCAGMRAHAPLMEELEAAFGERVKILNIGDSVRARRIIDAVAEGRRILLALEELSVL